MSLTHHPATPDRWDDLASLFGPNGAHSNCWCTWWILSSRQWSEAGTGGREAVLHGLVQDGAEPGILAYDGAAPVGWVAVGPRTRYARMMSPRATVNGPLDWQNPGWVVNCFFIPRGQRRRGIARGLLDEAVRFAFDRGATYVAGHPIDTSGETRAGADLYVGTLSMFLDAGFTEVGRRGTRPVVRIDRADHVRS
jgi:GNAT superfamily N-acetyltransferase